MLALVFHHNVPVGPNAVDLFVDYALQTSGSGVATPVAWANFPICFGAGNFPGGQDNGPFRRNFDGSIDEVRIRKVSLSPSEFVAIPPDQFALVTISNAGGGLNLRWDSLTNHAYQVQFTPQFPAIGWTKLGGVVPGVGNPLTLPGAFVPDQPQRFFRVLQAP